MYEKPEYIKLIKQISSCQNLLELNDSVEDIKKFIIKYNIDKNSKEYEKIIQIIDLVKIKLSNKFKTC